MQPLYIGLGMPQYSAGLQLHRNRVPVTLADDISRSAAGTALVLAGGLALAVWFAGRALAPDDLGLVIFTFQSVFVGLVTF